MFCPQNPYRLLLTIVIAYPSAQGLARKYPHIPRIQTIWSERSQALETPRAALVQFLEHRFPFWGDKDILRFIGSIDLLAQMCPPDEELSACIQSLDPKVQDALQDYVDVIQTLYTEDNPQLLTYWNTLQPPLPVAPSQEPTLPNISTPVDESAGFTPAESSTPTKATDSWWARLPDNFPSIFGAGRAAISAEPEPSSPESTHPSYDTKEKRKASLTAQEIEQANASRNLAMRDRYEGMISSMLARKIAPTYWDIISQINQLPQMFGKAQSNDWRRGSLTLNQVQASTSDVHEQNINDIAHLFAYAGAVCPLSVTDWGACIKRIPHDTLPTSYTKALDILAIFKDVFPADELLRIAQEYYQFEHA